MLYSTLLAILVVSCESADILVVNPFSSRSHHMFIRPMSLELAQRGHNVTVITFFPEANPPHNYQEVVIKAQNMWDISAGGKRPNIFDMAKLSHVDFYDLMLWKGGPAFTEYCLKTPVIQAFLAKDLKFDLVIANYFHIEAWYMISHKYQAPLILVSTFGNSMRHNIFLKNPLQQATVLSEFLTVENPTSFWGRLQNFFFSSYEFVYTKYWYLSKQEEVAKKYIPNLPQPVPSLYEVQSNVSLTLYNSHFSFDPPTAYLPNIVEIGGMHLSEAKGDIPEKLRKILDDATDGFIYVNFGSNLHSSELPQSKRNALFNVFRKLKHTVLWKWEDNELKNIPKNLVIQEWFPQKEILSHPNIKLFISHGGLLGTQEAVFHGVPILGVPVYGDQFNNLLQIEEHGMGLLLKYDDINESTLEIMLHELLSNDSYRIKAKELSKRFKDRPMSPLETAIYWIEYVIRHKGGDFIKNPARNLHWIESSMLDVYGFILMLLVITLLIIFKLVQTLVQNVSSSLNLELNSQKKHKTN